MTCRLLAHTIDWIQYFQLFMLHGKELASAIAKPPPDETQPRVCQRKHNLCVCRDIQPSSIIPYLDSYMLAKREYHKKRKEREREAHRWLPSPRGTLKPM